MEDYVEALKKIALGLGVKTVEQLSSRFDPDKLLADAKESLNISLKETLREIFGDTTAEPVQDLIDRAYQNLDSDTVIEAIKEPLAKAMADWLKETEDFINSMVTTIIDEYMNLDELYDKVAEKIADRVNLNAS